MSTIVSDGTTTAIYDVASTLLSEMGEYTMEDMLSSEKPFTPAIHGRVAVTCTETSSMKYDYRTLKFTVDANLCTSITEVILLCGYALFIRSYRGFKRSFWDYLFGLVEYDTFTATATTNTKSRTILTKLAHTQLLERLRAEDNRVAYDALLRVRDRAGEFKDPTLSPLLNFFGLIALVVVNSIKDKIELGSFSDPGEESLPFFLESKTLDVGTTISIQFNWYTSKIVAKRRLKQAREQEEAAQMKDVNDLYARLTAQQPTEQIITQNQEEFNLSQPFINLSPPNVQSQGNSSSAAFGNTDFDWNTNGDDYRFWGCYSEAPSYVQKLLSKTKKSERDKYYFMPTTPGLGCFEECLSAYFKRYPRPQQLSRATQDTLAKIRGRAVDIRIITVIAQELGVAFLLHEVTSITAAPADLLEIGGVARDKVGNVIIPRAIGVADTTIHLLSFSQTTTPIKHVALLWVSATAANKASCAKCGEWLVTTRPPRSNTSTTVTCESPWVEHINNCSLCVCGRFARKDGAHYLTCKKGKIEGEGSSALEVPVQVGDKKQVLQNQYFADMECATFGGEYHVPYCIAVKNIAKELVWFHVGRDCLSQFITYLHHPSVKGYLWFHNGSGYDTNFLIQGLLEKAKVDGKPVDFNIISKGSRVYSFNIDKPNKAKLSVRDMFLFLPISLAKLCKDFAIPNESSKTSFDHSKIKTWEDVETHRKEIIRYCISDVKALQAVYKVFMPALYEICPILPATKITLSGLAYDIWCTIAGKDVISRIHAPRFRYEYEIARKAYFGGRVHLTRRSFESQYYNCFNPDHPDYALDDNGVFTGHFEGNDFLKMVDIVSLYPAMMRKYKYPCGKPTLTKVRDPILFAAEQLCDPSDGADPHWKTFWMTSMLLVDVSPPEVLAIPYLMSRDEEGGNIQGGNEIIQQWYTGIDLYEARKIGYIITKCYAYLQWPNSCMLFDTYINAMFKVKNDNAHNKTGGLYVGAKWAMNSVSGKLAQKVIETNTRVVSSLDALEGDIPESIDEIFGGFLVTLPVEKKKYNFPTYLSPMILSYARRHMSKIMRSVGGYQNSKYSYLYTDTDSLIVTQETFDRIPEKYKGKELGQLEDEYPDGVIVAGKFLAPKTYSLAIVKNNKMHYKVRAKGIPHRGDVFDVTQVAELNSDENTGEELFPLRYNTEVNDDTPFVELGTRKYLIYSDRADEKTRVPYIDCDIMDRVLQGDTFCDVIYGSLERAPTVRGEGKQHFQVRPKWCVRSLSINNWWRNSWCTRQIEGIPMSDFVPLKSHLPPNYTPPPNNTVPMSPGVEDYQTDSLAPPPMNFNDWLTKFGVDEGRSNTPPRQVFPPPTNGQDTQDAVSELDRLYDIEYAPNTQQLEERANEWEDYLRGDSYDSDAGNDFDV